MPLTESDTIRIRQFLQRMESGLVEGMQVYATYHDSNLAATPSDPVGNGATGGWHREPTEASNWMSIKTALKDTAGTWGTPIRVFGLQGTETAGVGLSADIPKLSQITFIGDGSSKVGWTAGTVEYGGNSYAITVKAVGDGSTDAYIYWDDADGQTSFKTTASFATAIAAHHWMVCINDSGKAIPAVSHRIILGGLIQADSITASTVIIAGTVTDTELSSGLNDDIAQGIADAATAQAEAEAKVKTFFQDAVPTAENAGDIWFDTNDGLKMHRATAAGDDQVTAGEWEHVDLTIIDGGNITAATILAASISTYNLTGANATFENLIVKTAHIDNLNVTTGKIDDDATTVYNVAATAAAITIATCAAKTTVQTLNHTSVGGSVRVTAAVLFKNNSAGSSAGNLYLYDGNSELVDSADTGALNNGEQKRIQVSFIDFPGSGAVTYTLKACGTGLASGWSVEDREMISNEPRGK